MQSVVRWFIYLKQCTHLYTSHSSRNVIRFGGVSKLRWGAISGRQHHDVCHDHKPEEQPPGPDGTPGRSAEEVQQQLTGELLEDTQRSAHTAG